MGMSKSSQTPRRVPGCIKTWVGGGKGVSRKHRPHPAVIPEAQMEPTVISGPFGLQAIDLLSSLSISKLTLVLQIAKYCNISFHLNLKLSIKDFLII